jgi:twinkle protein
LLRGSGSIGQLSDIVVGQERDQQDEERANITTLRILKNRFTGDTGLAGELTYDRDTGRLSEVNGEELFGGNNVQPAATKDHGGDY